MVAQAHGWHRHTHSHHRIARSAPLSRGVPLTYGTLADGDGQPTCRYADGTPYDPDILGGMNHVGEGGPAANWNGFDPCAY